MSEFCVIGSGISGATIANLLNKKNSVILFDKARGPGGRASFKRMKGNIGFDHGTQYFSPKTPEFKVSTIYYQVENGHDRDGLGNDENYFWKTAKERK